MLIGFNKFNHICNYLTNLTSFWKFSFFRKYIKMIDLWTYLSSWMIGISLFDLLRWSTFELVNLFELDRSLTCWLTWIVEEIESSAYRLFKIHSLLISLIFKASNNSDLQSLWNLRGHLGEGLSYGRVRVMIN